MSWDTITVIEHEKIISVIYSVGKLSGCGKRSESKTILDGIGTHDFCVTGEPGERFSGWTSRLWPLTALSFCAPHSPYILYHYKLLRQFVFHFEFPFSHDLHVYYALSLWGEIRCWSRQVTKASAAAPKGSCRSHVELCSFVRFLLLLFFMLCYCKEKLDVDHLRLRKGSQQLLKVLARARLKCVSSFAR